MRSRFNLFYLAFVLLVCFQLQAAGHFFDEAGNNLEKYDQKYFLLTDFYGEFTPKQIVVRYHSRKSSQFHTRDNSISLALYCLKDSPENTVIHETSHLAMSNLTQGASVTNQFRFFDEGMANIMGYKAEGRLAIYKQKAINIAEKQRQENNISFKKVQDWTNYFGDWSGKKDKLKRNPNAYPVGSSFVFYIQDTYGIKKLKEFFNSVGKTKDLETSLRNVFNVSAKDIEAAWLEYIKKSSTLEKCVPHIVEMFPANNSKEVLLDLKEIYVKFDRPMDTRRVVFITKCAGGLCSKDAYWKNATTFAVKVNPALEKDFKYNSSLGDARRGLFLSEQGCELPVQNWSFQTIK